MKLQKVCLFLFGILFFLLLNEIVCIANSNYEGNLITNEDRRAADTVEESDQFKSNAKKRGLYDSLGIYNQHQFYPSGGYGGTALTPFTSSGYSFGPASNYHYYPQPNNAGYPNGHNYGYEQAAHDVNHGHHSNGHGYAHSALALKGLLIPLAGIALLGAAAALSTNPVLLQLGVVNGRRRRRRSFNPNVYPTDPRLLLNKK